MFSSRWIKLHDIFSSSRKDVNIEPARWNVSLAEASDVIGPSGMCVVLSVSRYHS